MPTESDRPKRLLSWTGERMVPWTDELTVVHEHLHRYLFAQGLVDRKSVLDVGSGEGYGSALLARRAARVTGIEIDAVAVEHARLNYPLPNLSFIEGSVSDLGRFEEGTFDVAVCFEVIEHLVDHEALVSGVARVLKPGGVFVVSTPDRDQYNEDLGYANPFHLKELSRKEFVDLLSKRFPHIALLGQRAVTGSLLVPLEGAGGEPSRLVVERNGGAWEVVPDPVPKYYLAIASPAPLPELGGQSLLVQTGPTEQAGPALRDRHPLLALVVMGARSTFHLARKQLTLAAREWNRRRARR